MSAPGRAVFGPRVERLDAAFDAAFERVRGRPLADAVFRAASDAGDFSAIWHVLNVGRGVMVRRPDQVVALAVGLAAESLLVNQGIKRLVRRERPTVDGDPRTRVRRPRTSSFPSGHASAAAFNATVLTAWDPRRAPLWWSVALVVGTSRVHVRIHHGSDVIAGAALGAALGVAAARLARRAGVSGIPGHR